MTPAKPSRRTAAQPVSPLRAKAPVETPRSPSAPAAAPARTQDRKPGTSKAPASAARSAGNRSDPASELPLHHTFRDPALFEAALTHSSLLHEAPESAGVPAFDNEQLEFLGDAVLSLVVAETLFRRFPHAREGDLTRMRASLVSSRSLAELATRLDLGTHLRLGRGEDRSGGRRKPALLADALEAVLAALYLDGGLPVAANFLTLELIEPALPMLERALAEGAAIDDHKSALQELLQSSGLGQPRYVLTGESGPDHERTFRIGVEIDTEPGELPAIIAEAEGSTKKRAQQEAARLALAELRKRPLQHTLRAPADRSVPVAKPEQPALPNGKRRRRP